MKMTRINKSRLLAKLLRWDKPECYEKGGWRRVDDILEKLGITIDELQKLVQLDPKNQSNPDRGRFELSTDLSRIRARDGHAKFVQLEEKTPADSFPEKLFHGSSLKSVSSILNKGVLSMDRNYVHLSADKAEAFRVASRRKYPVIFEIDSQAVIDSGSKIYAPESIAWLCGDVPAAAIKDCLYIGQMLTFYECQEQAAAAMSICNNQSVLTEVAEKVKRIVTSFSETESISAIAERIADNITFETDDSSKYILGFATIPVDSDVSYYEAATEYLDRFFRTLRSYFAAAFLNNMPAATLDDKKRIQLYMEMSLLCLDESELRIIKSVDPLDVRQSFRIAELCHVFPILANDSLSGLIQHIDDTIRQNCKKERPLLYLQMYIPGEECGNIDTLWSFLRNLDEDNSIISGIYGIPAQKDYKARLLIMETK